MTFQTKKGFIKKNKSITPFRISLGGTTGMRERCFRSRLLLRNGCSVEYVYQNGCTARLVNRGRILMNVTLSLTGLMAVYFLYQVMLLH